MEWPNHGVFARLKASVMMRCPRCCRGPVYRGLLRMYPACPVCGLVFERGPGYFTGAMYASYTLAIFGTLPVWMGMLVAGAGIASILAVASVMIVVLMPVFFHYSRVVWMHVDQLLDPRTP